MSLAELKRFADDISPDERLFLEHYLAHLRRIHDPENGVELDRRWDEMQEGKEVTLEEAIRLTTR